MSPYRLAGNGVAHRYWRIYITANDGDATYCGFTEIELRTSVGGADVTVVQLQSGAASALSVPNTANAAFRAVDNSDTAGWLSQNKPTWWKYDFGHAGHTGNPTENIRQILIKGSFNVPAASPKDFLLEWSDDGSVWTTALTVTGETGWTGASDARTFNVP